MQDDVKEYSFKLTKREAEYLNAAVCDFFHRMRAAASDGLELGFEQENYQNAMSLWTKVEQQIQIKERK